MLSEGLSLKINKHYTNTRSNYCCFVIALYMIIIGQYYMLKQTN